MASPGTGHWLLRESVWNALGHHLLGDLRPSWTWGTREEQQPARATLTESRGSPLGPPTPTPGAKTQCRVSGHGGRATCPWRAAADQLSVLSHSTGHQDKAVVRHASLSGGGRL